MVSKSVSFVSHSRKSALITPGCIGYLSTEVTAVMPAILRASIKLPVPPAGSRKDFSVARGIAFRVRFTSSSARFLGV